MRYAVLLLIHVVGYGALGAAAGRLVDERLVPLGALFGVLLGLFMAFRLVRPVDS